ncbi:MAG TPA: oligosaccharide flippase family protein [Phycisphaerales bacterium]
MSTPEQKPEPSTTVPGKGGYASAALKGSFWMIVNTILTRIGSFIAQIFLAWWLTKYDFGLSGVAIALSGIASVLRDGGVRQILLKDHQDHDRLLGPCFWMAMAFNIVLAVLLTVIAWPAADLYNDKLLIPMLLVIAWAIPLGTPGGILLTKLLADMRYRENASVMTASAMTRYLSSIAFAYMGFGALSFALPNILCALVENAMAWHYCRQRPWVQPPHPGMWWPLFLRSRWALVAILGISGMNQGPGAAIGLAAPLEVVGVYTFTFLIVVQVGSLLSTNINQVLVPVFTRLAEDEERKRAAVLRTLRQIMVLATLMSVGLAVTFRPFEAMVWGAKWAVSVLPVQIVGMGYAVNVLIAISLAVQQARGQFRAWGLGLISLAIGTMGSAYLGAWYAQPQLSRAIAAAMISPGCRDFLDDAVQYSSVCIAVATAGFGVLSSLVHVAVALKPLGVSRRSVLTNAVKVWVLGLIAGAATIVLDMRLAGPIGQIASAWLGQGGAARFVGEGVLFCVAGGVFVVLFAGLVRLLTPETLRESLQIIPGRLRGPAARFLALRPEGG